MRFGPILDVESYMTGVMASASYAQWFAPGAEERSHRQRLASRKRTRAVNGLYDLRGAADRLNTTPAKVRAFVDAGQLKFINIGLGQKRPRYRFAESDLDQLIAAKTSQESVAACPSSRPRRVRHISGTTSNTVVIDFMAQLDAHLARKR